MKTIRLMTAATLLAALAVATAASRTSANDEKVAAYFRKHPSADANGDGTLTLEEALAHRKTQRGPNETGNGKRTGNDLKPTLADVRYGKHPRNVLDFYRAESETPTPVVIYWHGGGFVKGDKQRAGGLGFVRDCLEHGISVVSGNYRFVAGSDSEPFPGSLMDGVRTIQFVRSQAGEWNLDPDRVALSGGSAGAVMALWIAVHDDFADAKSPDPLTRISSRVSGVVAFNGPTTLDPSVIVKHIPGNPKIHSSVGPIFGVASVDDLKQPEHRPRVAEFSALTHVTKDDPFLFLHYRMRLSDPAYNIHHSKFGRLMLERFREIGHAKPPMLVCPEGPNEGAEELDYLKQVFGMK